MMPTPERGESDEKPKASFRGFSISKNLDLKAAKKDGKDNDADRNHGEFDMAFLTSGRQQLQKNEGANMMDYYPMAPSQAALGYNMHIGNVFYHQHHEHHHYGPSMNDFLLGLQKPQGVYEAPPPV